MCFLTLKQVLDAISSVAVYFMNIEPGLERLQRHSRYVFVWLGKQPRDVFHPHRILEVLRLASECRLPEFATKLEYVARIGGLGRDCRPDTFCLKRDTGFRQHEHGVQCEQCR